MATWMVASWEVMLANLSVEKLVVLMVEGREALLVDN